MVDLRIMVFFVQKKYLFIEVSPSRDQIDSVECFVTRDSRDLR